VVDQPLEIASAVALALALAGSAYMLFAAIRVRAMFGRRAADGAAEPSAPVTLLKPLHRDEPGLEAALGTAFAQDYPGEVQVVFGLQDPADPALAIAQRLRAAHAGRDVAVVVDPREHGTNRKVSNLINMAAQARHDLIVLADSDIAVPPDYLRRVLGPLARGEAGVVTCAYYGAGRAGIWSRLAAMDLSYRFLPSVAVGVSLGLARPCMGSTIALRRETLRQIGGFEAFADRLADDYAIGESVRRAGQRSRVAPVLVAHGCAEQGLSELIAHELRWARTVRGVDPAGFAGSIVTYPLPLALIGVLLAQAAPGALAILAVALICRAWMIRQVEKVAEPVPGAWWLFPARDMLSLIVFVGSFFVRTVQWRGARFRIDARGDLSGV
jgi:ceramide glucosyltransferase